MGIPGLCQNSRNESRRTVMSRRSIISPTPSRVGQIVVMLKPGNSFTRQRLAATMPVPPHSSGMHGFDPADSVDIQGSAIIWRMRHPIGGQDLGPFTNTQWDAPVCKLLGIDPPATADSRAIVVR